MLLRMIVVAQEVNFTPDFSAIPGQGQRVQGVHLCTKRAESRRAPGELAGASAQVLPSVDAA
jgi:hypothetical protein